jgi:hypothetical protein
MEAENLFGCSESHRETRGGANITFCRNSQSRLRNWWSGPGLNRQPSACKADALPIELPPHKGCRVPSAALLRPTVGVCQLVGLGRVELPTSPLSGARSSQLSYRPF